jgi:hypothetical protein
LSVTQGEEPSRTYLVPFVRKLRLIRISKELLPINHDCCRLGIGLLAVTSPTGLLQTRRVGRCRGTGGGGRGTGGGGRGTGGGGRGTGGGGRGRRDGRRGAGCRAGFLKHGCSLTSRDLDVSGE